MAAYNKYQDAAFTQAKRSLDPMWSQNQRSFDQSMINKGFSPGSKGYTAAEDNLNRARNDQYNSAAFNAMQFGEDTRRYDTTLGENKRQFDSNFGLASDQFRQGKKEFGKTFGEQQRQFNEGTRRYDQGFGEDARRYDQGFGEDTRRYDQGFGEGQRQFDLAFGEDQYRNRRDFGEDTRRYDQGFDLNEMLQLDNVSRAYNDQAYRDAVFNASRDDQQMAQLMSIMGFGPAGGADPINMGSAFNNALTGEAYNAKIANDRVSDYTRSAGSIFDWWQNRGSGEK